MVPLTARALPLTACARDVGSGKTHTMMGPAGAQAAASAVSRRNAGMYVLAARDIFALLLSPEHEHLRVCTSFFEIYG